MARKKTAGRKKSSTALKGNWKKARETTESESPMGDPVPLDPGVYIMQLVSGEIGEFGDKNQIMFKWAVLGDDENTGVICTEWEGIYDSDRLMWLQRKLAALGVDLNECNVETEKDLQDLIDELINDGVCAKVKVVEKDGYINMKTRGTVDVEESELFDPDEVLKNEGQGGSSDGGGDDTQAAEPATAETPANPDEYDFKENEVVTFEHEGKKLTGKIVDFTDDDEAKIKVEGRRRSIVKSCDDIEPVDAKEAPKTEAKAEEKKDDEDGEPFKRSDFKTGERVRVEFTEEDDTILRVDGVVSSVPPRGNDIQFTGDDTGEPEMIAAADVMEKLAAEEKTTEEETAEADDSKGDDEPWEAGQECQFMDGKKQRQGVLRDVKGKIGRVKCEGVRKLFDVPVADLEDRA